MMEDEKLETSSNSISLPLLPSSNEHETSSNVISDTIEGSQNRKKTVPIIIPESPSSSSPSLPTKTSSNVTKNRNKLANNDDEMDFEKQVSTISNQRSMDRNSTRPGSSINDIAFKNKKSDESLIQNGKILHNNTNKTTNLATVTDVIDLDGNSDSQETTSKCIPIKVTPPRQITLLTPLLSAPPRTSPSSSSTVNQLGKHHRQSSSTKSTSTSEHRLTRARSNSRSVSPTAVRQPKKIIRLSISSPLAALTKSQGTKVIALTSTSPASSPISSPKLTPPPSSILRHLLPTGYVYDVFMSYHATLDTFDIHPEDPRRIFFIYREMTSQKLLEHCERIPIRKATSQEILAVHQFELLKTLAKTKDMTRKELMDMENSNDSIYVNNHSYEASLYAAGGVMELCKAVVEDKVKNGFAIVRPPGHHAESDVSMGFCFINNVAIAAHYCIQQLKLKRIMIVDWDVHFGNGTHQIFANNPDVLYLSIHRYNNGSFYPGDDNGSIENVGDAPAKGRSVNIPWPKEGATDNDYLYAFHQVVMPIGYEFQPELLIVSAGFDAADGDDIGMCKVSPAGFSNMTHLLKGLANGRMVMALEGGYNLKVTSVSATACMSVLMGEAPMPLNIGKPSRDSASAVNKVKAIHSKYWRSLQR